MIGCDLELVATNAATATVDGPRAPCEENARYFLGCIWLDAEISQNCGEGGIEVHVGSSPPRRPIKVDIPHFRLYMTGMGAG